MHASPEHHDHPIHQPTAVTRRQLLAGAAVGVGASVLPMLLGGTPVSAASIAAPARKRVRLAGFTAFQDSIRTYRSGRWYLVEFSGALPTHAMMVGISNWQQQVPVPQNYTGTMAWQIPAQPKPAAVPVRTATSLRRQAIALAVNGVPIFNALNNRGEDSNAIGELDGWGGHCGRGDDYHYHVAPLHLQSIVGNKAPIAYALDGYPIYGTTEPDGQPMQPLDPQTHGHLWRGGFHYHGTATYPYTCAAMYGEITVVDDMITPQPVPPPMREATAPLPGAVITEFARVGGDNYHLEYTIGGQTFRIDYRATLTTLELTFVNPDGTERQERYSRPASRQHLST